MIVYDCQKTVVSPLIILLAGPTPYDSDKVVPYKYNSTMVENGKEFPIPSFSSVVSIVDVCGVTRSGRMFVVAAPKRTEDVMVEKSTSEKNPVIQADQSSILNHNVDQ